MDIKHNEATKNRPQGPRVIDAPYVHADLAAFIEQVKDEKAWEKSDRNGITVFKSDGMTIVLTALKNGAVIKDNVVDGIFVVQMLEGTIRLKTEEGEWEISANQLVAFHSGISHSIEAKKDSVILMTNHTSHQKASGTETTGISNDAVSQ